MSGLPTLVEQGLPPSIIDDSNPNDIYLGYFIYNKFTEPNNFLIKRIVVSIDLFGNKITQILYPEGKSDFQYNWYRRFTYEYRPEFDCQREGTGYCYNPAAIDDARLISSSANWKVPAKSDFDTLIATVGGALMSHKLKKIGQNFWRGSSIVAPTDEYGFSAIGSGKMIFGINPQANDQAQRDTWGTILTLWASDANFLGVKYFLQIADNDEITQLIVYPGYDNQYGALRLLKTDDIDPGYYVGNDFRPYKTCKIGNQVWLAENIKETLYRNLEPITLITDYRNIARPNPAGRIIFN